MKFQKTLSNLLRTNILETGKEKTEIKSKSHKKPIGPRKQKKKCKVCSNYTKIIDMFWERGLYSLNYDDYVITDEQAKKIAIALFDDITLFVKEHKENTEDSNKIDNK